MCYSDRRFYSEIRCHCNALGGIILASLEKKGDTLDSKTRKKLHSQFERIDMLLFAAAVPSCVLIESPNGVGSEGSSGTKSVSRFPSLALQFLQDRISIPTAPPAGRVRDLHAYVKYGAVVDAAARVQYAYFQLMGEER